jgi:hypothetical protein
MIGKPWICCWNKQDPMADKLLACWPGNKQSKIYTDQDSLNKRIDFYDKVPQLCKLF